MPSPSIDTTKRILRTYGVLLLALAIELVLFDLVGRQQGLPSFLSVNSLVNILNRSVVYGIATVGMTFVILTAGIDLSVGSLIAFGGVVAAKVVVFGVAQGAEGAAVWNWILLGWAAAVMTGLLTGSLSALVITRFDVPPFIATLAVMSSARGLGYLIAGGQSISALPAAYQTLGRARIGGVLPISVLVMVAIFVLGAVLLNYTRFGRYTLAIGGGEEAARLSGVPIARMKWAIYAMSGGLAAVAGIVLSSRLGSGDPKVGMGDELGIIAAVVVGGTSLAGGRGGIGGTFCGLLVIAVLNAGLNWVDVESFGQQVILGGVILAAVLMDRWKR